MKKTSFIFFVIVCFILISANAHFFKGDSNFIVTALGDKPNLPSTPYDYRLKLPAHLLTPPDTIVGYQVGGIDTTKLPIINDKIATLGRVLFYDKTLSANENIACASCHIQANSFADPHPQSQGVSVKTKRNSMHLNDLGWSNNSTMFWDKKNLKFEDAIKLPLKDGNEIGATLNDLLFKLSMSEFYPQLFKEAYGSTEITEKKVVEALGHFIKSMNTFSSKLDKVQAKNDAYFTIQERRGELIFANSCALCHTQGNGNLFFNSIFTDSLDIETEAMFFANGYIGKDATDKGATQNIENVPPLFKMPTLRNIEVTAPYMHDGGLKTLDDLINFYSEDVVGTPFSFVPDGGFNFTNQQKSDLKAFLKTLTDQDFLVNEKWSDPFDRSNSIKAEDLGAVVKVFPNPFDQVAQIEIDGYPNERKDITVRNSGGQVIFSDYFFNDNYKLEKNRLTSGIYILTITCKNKVGSYKIVVK